MQCFGLFPHNKSVVHWLDTRPEASSTQDEDEIILVHRPKSPHLHYQRVLMEVVGAMGLSTKKRQTVDPYVKIQMYCDDNDERMRVVHRTHTIPNDGDPIWTAQTKALCVLEIPLLAEDEDAGSSSSIAKKEAADTTTTATNKNSNTDDMRTSVLVDVCHGNSRLGRVTLSFEEILQHCSGSSHEEGERLEYHLEPPTNMKSRILETAVLALRFRKATERDVEFVEKLQKQQQQWLLFSSKQASVRDTRTTKSPGTPSAADQLLLINHVDERKVAADINFQLVQGKALFQSSSKKDKNGQKLLRVQPYPDPDRPDTTEWMTPSEIEHATFQPSTKWVTAGGGDGGDGPTAAITGTVYLEILGCDNLPQMDTDLNTGVDLTDAFCVAALEDNILRTDVIWDNLHPRWPAWSTRAFCFSVRHPGSLLCLAVFDYDGSPLDGHDPIGRIVVQLHQFQSSLTYTLHYALQDDPTEQPVVVATDATAPIAHPNAAPRGTIIVRLRVEWEEHAMALFRSSPPRFIINVDNERSYNVLCYTTRGAVYMDEASLKSVKLLASEIVGYWSSYCFVLDVALEILLWRGRWHVTQHRSIWWPIHSVVLFTSAVVLIEYPHYALPIFLYGVVWILLSINYHASRHPYPWKRVPSSLETNLLIILGRRSLFSSSFRADRAAEIEPNAGTVEGARLEKLDRLKAARMSALIQYTLSFVLKVYHIYSKTSDSAVKITTETHSWNFLSGRLYYVHMLLKMICQYLRLGRNFLSWKSSSTAVVTTRCIIFATLWLILPMNSILQWTLRILAWTLLGPWMKLVDVRYFRPWYATKDELIERIQQGTDKEETDLPDFDSLLENETFRKMTKAGRIKAEELYKLRDMRTLLYGAFSEAMPTSDNSRYPAIPLPQSTAVHSEWSVPPQGGSRRGYHVTGQKLTGHMVHSPFRSKDKSGEAEQPNRRIEDKKRR